MKRTGLQLSLGNQWIKQARTPNFTFVAGLLHECYKNAIAFSTPVNQTSVLMHKTLPNYYG